MRTVVTLGLDAVRTSLATYGFIALLTIGYTGWGSAAQLWPVVPISFAIQFCLKLIFSRDERGTLKANAGG